MLALTICGVILLAVAFIVIILLAAWYTAIFGVIVICVVAWFLFAIYEAVNSAVCWLRSINYRKALLGWICQLRGQHVARKPWKGLIALKKSNILWVADKVIFRCICGETHTRTFDAERGGRIPVPFGWALGDEHGQAQATRQP